MRRFVANPFSVLFFVSVGMFEPSILVKLPVHVLGVLAIIIVGKSIAASITPANASRVINGFLPVRGQHTGSEGMAAKRPDWRLVCH